MERCGCGEDEAREYLKMYLQKIGESCEVSEVIDFSGCHTDQLDHGRLFRVEVDGEDRFIFHSSGDPMVLGLGELCQVCDSFAELNSLMRELGIDDPRELGVELEVSAKWEPDQEKQVEGWGTMQFQGASNIVRHDDGIWGFGMSGCGEIFCSEITGTGTGKKSMVDAFLLEAMTAQVEKCFRKNYDYDGSSWIDPTEKEEEEEEETE